MKFGLNLYSLHKLIATEDELRDVVARLKQMGYDHVQYSGGPFDPDRIARVSRELSMPVCLTHVPLQRILDEPHKLMQEHALFGCKNIGLGMLPQETFSNEQQLKETFAALERSAQVMHDNGYTLTYHNHHYEFSKLQSGQRILDYVIENTKYLNFTLDTYWVQYGGCDVLDYVAKLKNRMVCVHLKDYKIVKETDSFAMKPAYAPVGNGNMDFPAIIDAMKKARVQYFLVEQDDACLYPDPFAEVKASIDYLKSNF